MTTLNNTTINFTELAPLFSCYTVTCHLLGYMEKEFSSLIQERIAQTLPKTSSSLLEREIQLLSERGAQAIAAFPDDAPPKPLPARFIARPLICGRLQGWMLLNHWDKGDKRLAQKGMVCYAINIVSGELCVHKLIRTHERELLSTLPKLKRLIQTHCIVPTQLPDFFFQIQKHCNQLDLFNYLFVPLSPSTPARYNLLEEREKIKISFDVAEAIAELHAHKVIHRDLKPENLLCDLNQGDLSIVLGDTEFATHESELQRRKEFKGTCGYLCPEAANPEYCADYTDDSWALGILLHIMLLGDHPDADLLKIGSEKAAIIKALQKIKEHPMHKSYPTPPLPSQPYLYIIYNLLLLDPKKRMSCTEAHILLRRCYAKETPLEF